MRPYSISAADSINSICSSVNVSALEKQSRGLLSVISDKDMAARRDKLQHIVYRRSINATEHVQYVKISDTHNSF